MGLDINIHCLQGKLRLFLFNGNLCVFFFFYSVFSLKKERGTASGTVTSEPYYVMPFLSDEV